MGKTKAVLDTNIENCIGYVALQCNSLYRICVSLCSICNANPNILISAFGWKGNPKHILDKVVDRHIELIISSDLFNELSETLDYPKFGFTEEQKNRFRSLILEIATFVRPTEKIDAVRNDPDDNIILEAAVAGNADYIVSGDPDILESKEFRDIKIVTARDFLEKIRLL